MSSLPRGPLILIVDDDLTTNRMIPTIVPRAGFQAICAFDAAGAVREPVWGWPWSMGS